MKSLLVPTVALVFSLGLAGCASDSAGTAPPIAPDAGGTTATTFTEVYARHFQGDSSAGHCVRCHSQAATKDGFYSFLVAANQIDTTDGTKSAIAVEGKSILWWMGSGGRMPKDDPSPNPAGATDIRSWVAKGAKND